jgi:hypothetical protein
MMIYIFFTHEVVVGLTPTYEPFPIP